MGFGKDGKGQILYGQSTITPGALAAKTVAEVGDGYAGVLEEDFRIIKVEGWANYEPQATGDVIIFGIASNDLSNTEIEECLEARPNRSDDIPESEQVMRPVWPIGILGESSANSGPTTLHFEKTLRWTFNDSTGWTWWMYNIDPSTALTTGSVLHIFNKYFGVWVT